MAKAIGARQGAPARPRSIAGQVDVGWWAAGVAQLAAKPG